MDINDTRAFNELTNEQRNVLLDWIDCFVIIKTINTEHSSYELKHFFENSKDGFYITNGQFKGAMNNYGYKHSQRIGTSNDCYAISEHSIMLLKADQII